MPTGRPPCPGKRRCSRNMRRIYCSQYSLSAPTGSRRRGANSGGGALFFELAPISSRRTGRRIPRWSNGATVMLRRYNSAQCSCALSRHADAGICTNTRAIRLSPALGRDRRAELNRRFRALRTLPSLGDYPGGIDTPLPDGALAVAPGIYWIIPQAWNVQRADCLYGNRWRMLLFNRSTALQRSAAHQAGLWRVRGRPSQRRPVLYVNG